MSVRAQPGNTVEQLICTMLLLLAGVSWGVILAVIVGNLSNLDPERDEFRRTMGELNKMMSRQQLPQEMRARLREYFHQSKHVRYYRKASTLLKTMSPTLQSEVTFEGTKEWLARVWFLSGVPMDFMVQLSLHLRPLVFAPGEVAPPGQLYIVTSGLALFGARVYGRGRIFGDDVILSSPWLKKDYCGRAMNYLDVLNITREELEEVSAAFPSVANQIRRCQVRLATRRQFVQEALRRRGDLDVGLSKSSQFLKSASVNTESAVAVAALQGAREAQARLINLVAPQRRPGAEGELASLENARLDRSPGWTAVVPHAVVPRVGEPPDGGGTAGLRMGTRSANAAAGHESLRADGTEDPSAPHSTPGWFGWGASPASRPLPRQEGGTGNAALYALLQEMRHEMKQEMASQRREIMREIEVLGDAIRTRSSDPEAAGGRQHQQSNARLHA